MYQPSTKTPKKVFQKGGFCNAKRGFLHAKMIYKIQLIGNKQVTLFVKLNR